MFTNTLSWTGSKWKPGKRFDVVSIFFEESLRFEDLRLRPELGVVMESVERNPDLGSLGDLQATELSSVIPVLHAHPVNPSHGPIQSQVL